MDNTQEIIQEQTNINVTMPKMYKVILHNDDFTRWILLFSFLERYLKNQRLKQQKS